MKTTPVRNMSMTFRLVFCALFVIVPGAVAIIAGWLPLWYVTEAAWRSSSLVEVPATVSAVELTSRPGSSRSRSRKFSVVASYDYEWQGVGYIGTQSTWPQLKITDEEHNTRLFRTLDGARAAKSSVVAWIDPQAPGFAIFDKTIPWIAPLIAVPVAIVFSLVAAGFSYAFVLMLRSKRVTG